MRRTAGSGRGVPSTRARWLLLTIAVALTATARSRSTESSAGEKTYAVGGTISGLGGTGLVLGTPGAPNLVVQPGTTSFTFANRLPTGAAYAVVVLQEPANPSQACKVLNGSGTVVAADVTGIVVSCRSAWSKVAAGGSHTVAVKTDGTLWAWGDDRFGQLGSETERSGGAPSKVRRTAPGLSASGFASVAAGGYHTVALRTDGALWAWGDNRLGQLGDGTTTTQTAPVQIGSGFASVGAGFYHTVAVKTDGTLWAWGDNEVGQLGAGDWWYTVPMPVP